MQESLLNNKAQKVNGEFYPCKPDIFEQTYTPEIEE